MCGLHLTYFKSEIQTEGLFLDASEAWKLYIFF